MPLLAAERQQKIIASLAEDDVGRIADFASEFEVTEETIRRDLEKLDRNGKLVRIRGGAIPIAERTRDTPFDVRRGANYAAKERIARQALTRMQDGSVIRLDASSRSWIGSFAEQALQRINISTLFLSSRGVDLERGLSKVDDAQARVKRRMIKLAEHVILLADHSKFGIKSAVSFVELSDVQTVITDSETDSATIDGLRELGLNV